jgi:hypothetical protein
VFKTKKQPTLNHVRHLLREAGYFVRYMQPLHSEKRFLMKLRAMKCKSRKFKRISSKENKSDNAWEFI